MTAVTIVFLAGNRLTIIKVGLTLSGVSDDLPLCYDKAALAC